MASKFFEKGITTLRFDRIKPPTPFMEPFYKFKWNPNHRSYFEITQSLLTTFPGSGWDIFWIFYSLGFDSSKMKIYQTLFIIQSQLIPGSIPLWSWDICDVCDLTGGWVTHKSLSLSFSLIQIYLLTSYYFIQTNREQIGTIK